MCVQLPSCSFPPPPLSWAGKNPYHTQTNVEPPDADIKCTIKNGSTFQTENV